MPHVRYRKSAQLTQAIQGALTHAAKSLSRFLDQKCRSAELSIVHHALDGLPALLGAVDQSIDAILLEVKDDLSGVLLIVIPSECVASVVELLVGGNASDMEMRESALGELGNTVASAFLNHLADEFRLTAVPTPPQTVRDTAGAMFSTLGAHLAFEGATDFPVIKTHFAGEDEMFTAYLVWLPYRGDLRILEASV